MVSTLSTSAWIFFQTLIEKVPSQSESEKLCPSNHPKFVPVCFKWLCNFPCMTIFSHQDVIQKTIKSMGEGMAKFICKEVILKPHIIWNMLMFNLKILALNSRGLFYDLIPPLARKLAFRAHCIIKFHKIKISTLFI